MIPIQCATERRTTLRAAGECSWSALAHHETRPTLKLVTQPPSVNTSASASPEEIVSFFRPPSSGQEEHHQERGKMAGRSTLPSCDDQRVAAE